MMATSRIFNLSFFVGCVVLAAVPVVAQESKPEPTLVAGSEVSLSAVAGAEWIQGAGPTSFEPDKVYVFECWATWCGPCVGLIPHVNDLHKKYYDKGLRVHGMNSWENDKDKVEEFVKKKGEGMSYPVAYVGKKSAFETEWLTAAGVKAIPYAFVVRNGKLLFGTEASRLTDSLVEGMLSGDEGAKKAAATIKAAYDARGTTRKLVTEIFAANRKKDAKQMAAKIKELEAIDSGHPELPVLKLHLLIANQDWPSAVAALNEMPDGEAKASFLMMTGMRSARGNVGGYPTEFLKALTLAYSEYINSKEGGVGPNHFASLSVLFWRIDDKQTATAMADKGLEVAEGFAGASEGRTGAFKRFAKSVNEGTMPAISDLSKWQIDARKKAAMKKSSPAE